MYKNKVKRFIDFVIALVALIVLLPVFIPISLILLLTGEHEVFYFQKRVGLGNKHFNIWKFATMLKNSSSLPGGLFTTRSDPRILPIGGFLRKTKLNELPQIVNILIGDMSIIGPRPLVDKTFNPYPEYIKQRIYNVRPGLTGIGSIVFRDEELMLSKTSMPVEEFYAKHILPYKGELELWYQDNLSVLTDFLLVFLTAWVIIFPQSEIVYTIFKSMPKMPEELKIINIK